jgi:uncharacterized protein YyaL (SSP411 family)
MLEGGRLHVTFREGRARLDAYLDDHAFLARGLLDLYESCFDPDLLEASAALARALLERFEDRGHGGFFFTAAEHGSPIARMRSAHDGALPSGAGVACEVLLRLATHVGEPDFRRAAERTLVAAAPAVQRSPAAHAALLAAGELAAEPPREVAILGDLQDPATRALLDVVRGRHGLRPVVQVASPDTAPAPLLRVLAGKRPVGGRPTAYVCRDYACRAPTTDPVELARQLEDRPH